MGISMNEFSLHQLLIQHNKRVLCIKKIQTLILRNNIKILNTKQGGKSRFFFFFFTVRVLGPREMHLVLLIQGQPLGSSSLQQRRVLHPLVVFGHVLSHVRDQDHLLPYQAHLFLFASAHLRLVRSPTVIGLGESNGVMI